MKPYARPEPSIIVEAMSTEDIAKYFPEAIRAELTGRFKTIDAEADLASTVFERIARAHTS